MAKRRFRRIGATLVVVVGLGLVVALATGEVGLVTTHGISMEPRFHTGDLAVIVPASHYRVGDVVGYHSPLLHIVVLHRIVAEHGGLFTFKGDNNSFLDPVRLPAAAIQGRLWLHISSGGVVLGWLRSPIVLGLLAFFVMALGVGGARRRRRSRGPLPGPGPRLVPERPPSDGVSVGWWPVGVALGLVTLSGFVTGLAWERPATRPSQSPLAYDQNVAFSYGAAAPVGITYPTGRVTTGDPVFLHLVGALQVGVQYTVTTGPAGSTDRAADTGPDVSGTIATTAVLEGPGGWTGPLSATAPVPFSGSSGRITVPLDLTRIPALEATFSSETGVPLGDPEIVVTPVVHVHGTWLGTTIGDDFSPTLAFRVEGPVLDLVGTSSGSSGSSSSKLIVTRTGAVERPITVPGHLSALGRSIGVSEARRLGLGGLVLSLLGLIGACLWRRRRRGMDETARIHATFGHDLVAVAASPVPHAPLVVDLATFDELARLARRYECVILEHAHADGHAYYVESGTTLYRCGVECAETDAAAPGPDEPDGPVAIPARVASVAGATTPAPAIRSGRRRLRPVGPPAADDPAKIADDVDLLVLLARAEWLSGIGDAAGHLREAVVLAQKAGLHQAMTEALLMNVRTAFDQGQPGDPERIEFLEFALGLAGDATVPRARLLGALAIESIFVADGPPRAALLNEARYLACRSGDPRAIVDVATATYVARSRASWPARQFAADRPFFDQARAAATGLGDPIDRATTDAQAAVIAFMAGDGELLRARIDDLAEVSEGGQNQVALRAQLQLGQAVATLEGRLAEAETLAARAAETWPLSAAAVTAAGRALSLIALRREQDRLAELIDVLASDDTSPPTSAERAAAAFALVETGRRDDAAIALHRAAQAGFGTIPDDIDWPVALALWSEVAARTGDRAAAAELYEILRLHDGMQMCAGAVGCGPSARVLALLETLLGRPADADRHFADAVASSHALVSPVWTARCQLDWAQARFDRGQTAEAVELIDDADRAAGEFALPALGRQWAGLREQLDRG